MLGRAAAAEEDGYVGSDGARRRDHRGDRQGEPAGQRTGRELLVVIVHGRRIDGGGRRSIIAHETDSTVWP